MDDYNKEFYVYLKQIECALDESLAAKSLTSSGVKSYIKHLPTKEINPGWAEEIYVLAEQMLQKIDKYTLVKKIMLK